MAANNALIVTDVNFDTIKANLQSYLSSQSDFQDYDFEGSGMQTIIQLLAYNTYQNAIYTNFVSNEMFLDSALVRNNVVSRAKMLGFTPTSARGSRAKISVTINPTGSPDSVTIPANTIFTSTVDGVAYKFQSINSTLFTRSDAGIYNAPMVIKEGDPVQESYTVSSVNPARYILNNENCDTSSLVVTVQESVSNTAVQVFEEADSINNVTRDTPVYFVQENIDGAYEIEFGDGVLGKKLSDGNIVKLNYNISNGSDLNGTNIFKGPATLAGSSIYSVEVLERASGGTYPQSVDSIKFNAPKKYSAQNRAVTAQDYKNLLLNNAPDLQTISVWGGEKNSPPVYGKVYISAKPIGDTTLTQSRKDELIQLLDDRNVVTIEPVFIDAQFLYVVPTIEIRYNPNNTSRSGDNLLSMADSKLGAYNLKELGIFNNNFYLSDFVGMLDDIDTSIMGVSVTIQMQRRFIPNTTLSQSYIINFNNPISNPHAGHQYTLSSSGFSYEGFTCYFDDDGNGNLRIYRLANNQRVYVNRLAGKVNYILGSVSINSVRFNGFNGDGIKINATPRDQVVKSVRSQICQLADASVTIVNNNTDANESQSRSLSSTIQSTVSTETGIVTASSTY